VKVEDMLTSILSSFIPNLLQT